MSTQNNKKNTSILVYKSYGGLGDIMFTIPSLYMMKQKFEDVTFATQPRLVNFLKSQLKGISVIDETLANEGSYDEVIELGNYPRFNNTSEKQPQIVYHTHRKVKQHSIEHYKDGIVSRFPDMKKTDEPYPYFEKRTVSKMYYTIHPGAGFLLKAWSIQYYAELIEQIFESYPQFEAKIIIGPNDPNPEPYFKNPKLKYQLITGDIEQVAHEVSGAQFHIGNDAGLTHLAGAFNIPILTIYGPTGPGSWGAFSEKVELIWGKKGNCNLRCNYNVIMSCQDRVCLSRVLPKQMFFQLLKLLNRIYQSTSKIYLLNPEFNLIIEDDSYIFKSATNEYLLEIKDIQSLKFLANNLSDTQIDVQYMPKQFADTFSALEKLNVFTAKPIINLDNPQTDA